MEEIFNIRKRQERRLTEQLLLYWNSVRGERKFPPISDIHPADLGDIWQDCFVVEIKGSSDNPEFSHTYYGSRIKDMYGGDLTDDVVERIQSKTLDLYKQVIETKQVNINEGEFTNLQDEETKYRQILLPLGPDEENIDHILGGMRYRQFDAESKDPLYSQYDKAADTPPPAVEEEPEVEEEPQEAEAEQEPEKPQEDTGF